MTAIKAANPAACPAIDQPDGIFEPAMILFRRQDGFAPDEERGPEIGLDRQQERKERIAVMAAVILHFPIALQEHTTGLFQETADLFSGDPAEFFGIFDRFIIDDPGNGIGQIVPICGCGAIVFQRPLRQDFGPAHALGAGAAGQV